MEKEWKEIRQTSHKEMESISQTQIKQAVDIKSTSPGEARVMDQRVPRIPKQFGSESKGKGSLQRFLSWGIN